MHKVLLILLIYYVQSLQTAVHNHFPGITWNAARHTCQPFGLENRHDYLQASIIPDEQEFWIGKAIYKETTPWIEIIGCFTIWQSDDHPFHSVASIGMCKQKCDSKNMGRYFGYRKRHQSNCVCQPNYIDQIHRSRIDSCGSSATVPLVSFAPLSASFFVYKDYDGIVHMSSDPGNCTTICCGSCNKPTQITNHLEGRRCSSVDNNIVGICGTGVKRWDRDYFGSLDVCILNNGLLSASDYCQRQGKQTGVTAWTNVFREEIEIIKKNDVNEDPVRCFSGVFILVNGQRILNVSDHRCSENKRFICKTNSSATASITQSTFSTIAMSKGKHINVSSGQSLTSAKGNNSLHTTGTMKTETTTQNPLFTLAMSKVTQKHTVSGPSFTPSSNKTSTTGAMIGGILGVCCILFVSAVLIVCKMRSKGIFKQTTKYVKEDTNQAHFSNTIYQDSNNTSDRTSAMPTSNHNYGLGGSSSQVYAVVNKLKKLENTDETYTDTGYGEYDHLHDIQNRRICPNENMYHSHGAPRNDEDQKYDSSDFGNRKLNEGNDLYDRSFSVVEGDYMSNENHDNHIRNNANIYGKAS